MERRDLGPTREFLTANFALYSTLMAIEEWGSLVCHTYYGMEHPFIWLFPKTRTTHTLKLKTIHNCFLCPYKRQSSMLCFLANTREVTMQVKC